MFELIGDLPYAVVLYFLKSSGLGLVIIKLVSSAKKNGLELILMIFGKLFI